MIYRWLSHEMSHAICRSATRSTADATKAMRWWPPRASATTKWYRCCAEVVRRARRVGDDRTFTCASLNNVYIYTCIHIYIIYIIYIYIHIRTDSVCTGTHACIVWLLRIFCHTAWSTGWNSIDFFSLKMSIKWPLSTKPRLRPEINLKSECNDRSMYPQSSTIMS